MRLVIDNNKAICYEYIFIILYIIISILKRLVILSQINISSKKSSSYIDYTIKKLLKDLLEEIIYITKKKQKQLDDHKVVFSSLYIERNFIFK